jgi:hypothetical protein
MYPTLYYYRLYSYGYAMSGLYLFALIPKVISYNRLYLAAVIPIGFISSQGLQGRDGVAAHVQVQVCGGDQARGYVR